MLLRNAQTCGLLILACVLAGAGAPVQAQEQPVPPAQAQQAPPDIANLSLEELMKIEVQTVYSASKYSQKVTEAPASVSIVTAEEIRRYGYRTLADILRSVRGFYVTYDRNYSYVGVRGFARPGDYNTRILLLVDGHRINDNIYDQALLGTEFPIEVDLIERVEVVRGPGSSLYGTSAFFGVVNVITKRGRHLKGVEAAAEAGSFGTYKGRFSYGDKFDNGLELLFSGAYYKSRGPRRLYIKEFDDPATNQGIAEKADDDRSHSFLLNLTFRNWTLRGVHGSREKGIPTGAYDTVFNDPRTRTVDERSYLDGQYEHTFQNQLSLLARLHYDVYRYDGTYVYPGADADSLPRILNLDDSRGNWWGAEFQLTKTAWRKHKLICGTEFRDNLRQDQSNYDLAPPLLYLDDRRESNNIGVYLQDEFAFRESLTLSAGVRYDRHTTFGGTTKPRVGLVYHPAPKTTVKLLYGEAFRAPNNYEFYYFNDAANPQTSTLKPETIRTSEVVLEQYLGERVRLSASSYLYRINGLISQQSDPVTGDLIFKNVGKVESKGLEGELETKLGRGWEGRIAYTLQDTQDQQTKQTLTNSPKHLGKLNLVTPLVKRKLAANLELQYLSCRKTLAGTDSPAFWLTNFTLFGQQLTKRLDLSLSVYNLFDQKYGDPGAQEHRQNLIEQNGRTFRVKLLYRFQR